MRENENGSAAHDQVPALLLTNYGGAEATQIGSVDAPQRPGESQVLVQVHASGVNALDWKIREGYVRDAFPLQLPTVLGIEMAGVVVAVGEGVDRFSEGDRVMGWLGTIGAYAGLVAVNAGNLSHIPEGMSFVAAAALPAAAQAAWQSLQAAGPIHQGQSVLIHGAAGALGGFAVQFAKRAGATVFATARGRYADYVHELGADHFIDYETQRFEDHAQDVDLVLDYVGGDTLNRSWSVLSLHGVIVSTTTPDVAGKAPAGKTGIWLMMKADPARLEKVAQDIVAGRLIQKIEAVVPLEELPQAIERNRTQPHLGKVVVAFVPSAGDLS